MLRTLIIRKNLKKKTEDFQKITLVENLPIPIYDKNG